MSKADEIRAKIKAQSAKGGNGPRVNRMLWAKDGEKYNVRFLHEIDDVRELTWYNSFKEGINVLGPENWGGEEDEGRFMRAMRLKKIYPTEQYMFLVWNLDEECVQILCTKAVASSFLPAITDWSEKCGTLCDRNYTLARIGSGPQSSYTVSPDLKESSEPKKATEAFKAFGFDEALETLRVVNKIPDEYATDEELDRREQQRKERAERQKEFEKNGGKASDKKVTTKEKPAKGKTTKEKTPWEKIDEDSEEDKAYFKRKEELDSYDDEDE